MKVVVYYGIIYGSGYSLVVSVMKYVIIVHWQKVQSIGKDVVQELFFYMNFLHPLVTILLQMMVKPYYFRDLDGIAEIEGCIEDHNPDFSLAKNTTYTKLPLQSKIERREVSERKRDHS